MIEVENILETLKEEDREFDGSAKFLFGRPPYEIAAEHQLPQFLEEALSSIGRSSKRGGMSFWTDAAILGEAGIPSVIFGPGGFGLHGFEEYVLVDDVLACRDALVELTRAFCA